MSLQRRPKRSSAPANRRSPPGCITFTSATFTTWKTTRRIARRVVRCSSSATGTSLDATTLMSVAAVHSATHGSQVASAASPGSGDGTGCRCSSGVMKIKRHEYTLGKDSVWVSHLCALAGSSSALARDKRDNQSWQDQSCCLRNYLSHYKRFAHKRRM